MAVANLQGAGTTSAAAASVLFLLEGQAVLFQLGSLELLLQVQTPATRMFVVILKGFYWSCFGYWVYSCFHTNDFQGGNGSPTLDP